MLVWSWIFFGFYLNFYCLLFKFKFEYRWLKCFRKKESLPTLFCLGRKLALQPTAPFRPMHGPTSRPSAGLLSLTCTCVTDRWGPLSAPPHCPFLLALPLFPTAALTRRAAAVERHGRAAMAAALDALHVSQCSIRPPPYLLRYISTVAASDFKP
jgi:hypothetical protein